MRHDGILMEILGKKLQTVPLFDWYQFSQSSTAGFSRTELEVSRARRSLNGSVVFNAETVTSIDGSRAGEVAALLNVLAGPLCLEVEGAGGVVVTKEGGIFGPEKFLW